MEERDVLAALRAHADRLREASGLEVGWLPDELDRDAGMPYVRVEDGELVYRARERGRLLFERRTTSLDELLQWVFHDLTRTMASTWELAHRVPGQDGRRRWFPKWVELMTMLRPEWGRATRRHTEAVLAEHPFRDRPRGNRPRGGRPLRRRPLRARPAPSDRTDRTDRTDGTDGTGRVDG